MPKAAAALPTSKSEWFRAAISEDIGALESMFARFKGSFDQRKTSVENKVVRGFAAIHYAVLYNATLSLQFLLPHELNLTIQQPCVIRTPNSATQELALSQGSDCLHLALAKARWNVAYDIIDYVRNSRQALSANVDAAGMSHLALLLQFPGSDDVCKLVKNDILQAEFVFSPRRAANLVFLMCANASIAQFEALLETAHFDTQRQEQLFLMVLDVDSQGRTVFDYLTQQTSDDAGRCRKLVYRLIPAAMKRLDTLERHAKHLERFKRKYRRSEQEQVQEYIFSAEIQSTEGMIVNEELFLPQGMRGVHMMI